MKSSQYVSLFLDEAQLLLEQAQYSLDQLPATQNPVDLQQELFRILHTLKGMASTLVDYPYFQEFTEISHALENLLDLKTLDVKVQNALQEGITSLQTLGQNIAHPQLQLPLNAHSLLDKLRGFIPKIETNTQKNADTDTAFTINAETQAKIAKLQAEGHHVYWLHVELMTACLMKSVRAMLVLHNLKEDTVTLISDPTLARIQQGDFDQDFRVLVASARTGEALKEIAESVSEIEAVSFSPYSNSQQKGLDNENTTNTAIEFNKLELNEFESRIIEEATKQSFQAVWLRFNVTQTRPFLAARIALVFRALEENGEIIKTVPDVAELEAENVNQAFEILMVTPQDAAAIRNRLIQEKEIELSFQIKVRAYPYAEDNKQEQMLPQLPKAVLKAALHFPARSTTDPLPQSIRVNKKHLEQLQTLTTQVLQSSHIDTPLQPKLVKDLYQTHFDLYFIPASQLFKRYPLIIKELERALGKQIQLTFSGEETLIPRSMADPLSNILLHLIRNSADHGLEKASQRKALEKPLTGKIHLSAALKHQQLCIKVKDDGAGIDLEKLKKNARKKNLFSASDIENLSNTEALELVFSPGLSTAENTTQVSGRGVGMDTVRTHIEQLSGSIHLQSTSGKGCCFEMVLPSSLEHNEVILFEQGEHYFGVPLEYFEHACFVSEAKVDRLFHTGKWLWQTREKLSHDICLSFRTPQATVHIQAKKLLGIERILFENFKTPTTESIQAVGVSSSQKLVKKLSLNALV